MFDALQNNSALMVRNQNPGGEQGRQQYTRPFNKKKENSKQQDRSEKYCDHCKYTGHTKDTCFKLIGYPDWFRDLKDQRKKTGGKSHANVAVDEKKEPSVKNQVEWKDAVVEVVQEELQKLMRGKGIESNGVINYAQVLDYAGINSDFVMNSVDSLGCGTWIVDTGASNHMCSDRSLFLSLKPAHKITQVLLSDGSAKQVRTLGDIVLSDKITLTNVLYVRDFQHNLLSVSRLLSDHPVKLEFHSLCCVLQHLQTKEVLVLGRLLGRLYLFDSNSFSPATIDQFYNHFLNSNV